MKQLLRKYLRDIIIHTAFWVGVWFFFVYFFSYNSENRQYIVWLSSGLLPITMISSYVMIYKIIPQYLLKKDYFRFGLYSFYNFVFSLYSITLIILINFIVLNKMSTAGIPAMSRNVVFVVILVNLIILLVSAVSLINYNFKSISKNNELQNKILETQLYFKEQEINYLKKQIHPHFLFNTLNTIYGFAIKQSKDTPEIILKLSNLLDYILYQVSKPKVLLVEEVLHVKEYIELEKIRFKDTLKIDLEVSNVDENLEVAPMILIPFVENAFKHGTLKDGFLQIKMQINYHEKELSLKIGNTFISDSTNIETGGIGLENIRRRLDLNYSNQYKLDTSLINDWYQVTLNIDLNTKAHE